MSPFLFSSLVAQRNQSLTLINPNRAFTQLTADRQFAHLGLMLLATLAQVDHAVSPFAPGPSTTDNDEQEDLAKSSSIPTDNGKDKTTSMDQQSPMGEDIGVAISRDDFLATTRNTRQAIEVDMELDTDTPAQTAKYTKKIAKVDLEEQEDTREVTIIKKKKRTREEDQSTVDVEKKTKVSATKVTTTKTSSSSTTATIKEKKKKQRKKAGDEFDDIFGGLL